jgi:dual specificity tyrosine-phosphorylation-regulated kinase 2/3/4
MEMCGIPPPQVIDKSRKKEHYFDNDYSPYLIEDEELGILRIPESRKVEDAIMTNDKKFIDFIKKCIELDPEIRMKAKEAINHPWIQDALTRVKSSPLSSSKVAPSQQ